MAGVGSIAQEVRRYWLSQGLHVAPVKSEDFVRLRGLRPEGIPDDYEVFLRVAGLPDDEDTAGFRFWLPSEVRSTHEVLDQAGYGTNASEPSIVIADYLQESWWYGLWLAGPFIGTVSLVLGHGTNEDPQPPLGTLVDFLQAYLQDDASLYPPGS